MANAEAGQVPQKQKKLVSPLIVLVLAIIFILWLMLLFMNKTFYEDFGMDISRNQWMYIGSMVMIIFIIILLVAGFPARTPTAQSTTPQAQQAQPVQITTTPQTTFTPAPQGVVVTTAKPLASLEAAPSVQADSEMTVVEAEPIVVEAEVVEAEVIEVEEEEKAPPKGLKMKKPRLIEFPKKVPGGVYGDTIIRIDPRTKLNLRTLLVRSCMICDRQGKCWEEIMDSIPREAFLENIECKKGLRKLRSHGTGEEPEKMKKKVVMKVKPKRKPLEESEETQEESF